MYEKVMGKNNATYLTVPITACDLAQARPMITEAVTNGAEMVELRLDYLDKPDRQSIEELVTSVKQYNCLCIATCRPVGEGGKCKYSNEERLALLMHALQSGVDYIDIELASLEAMGLCDVDALHKLQSRNCREGRVAGFIISHHDFEQLSADINRYWVKLLALEESSTSVNAGISASTDTGDNTAVVNHYEVGGNTGAGNNTEDFDDAGANAHANIEGNGDGRDIANIDIIPKIAYKGGNIVESFAALDMMHNYADRRLIALAMGQQGMISRLLAKKLGAFVCFASIREQQQSAPGQVTLGQMKKLYHWDTINADTEVFGIIGCPVAHSLSPLIHNTAFTQVGYNGLYIPLLVDGGREGFYAFMEAVQQRPWLGMKGFSVTVPHKQNALEYVREHNGYIEPLADKIGAVNTLVIGPDGKLSAYNTDYAGALAAITETLHIELAQLNDMPVAVVGAGGVARAVVAGLTDLGAKVTVYNRTLERGRQLAERFGCQWAGLDDVIGHKAQMLINCTSVGMHPAVDACPVPADCLREDMIIFDTIYNPLETKLLSRAGLAGAQTVSGLTMLVHQAALQFKLFTGQEPPVEHITRVLSNSYT